MTNKSYTVEEFGKKYPTLAAKYVNSDAQVIVLYNDTNDTVKQSEHQKDLEYENTKLLEQIAQQEKELHKLQEWFFTSLQIRSELEEEIQNLYKQLEQKEIVLEQMKDAMVANEAEVKLLSDKLDGLTQVSQRPQMILAQNDVTETETSNEQFWMDKKILVIGGCKNSTSDLLGVAKKQFGLRKENIVFETDYTKIKKLCGSLQYGNKYDAVILGPSPHKVENLGEYNSFVDRVQLEEGYPFSVVARSANGKLKFTKESFKKALTEVLEHFENEVDTKDTVLGAQ